jgi:hypothetical protein
MMKRIPVPLDGSPLAESVLEPVANSIGCGIAWVVVLTLRMDGTRRASRARS